MRSPPRSRARSEFAELASFRLLRIVVGSDLYRFPEDAKLDLFLARFEPYRVRQNFDDARTGNIVSNLHTRAIDDRDLPTG